MKTVIALLTAAALLSLGAPKASAHDGWSTTGKILTGVAIGGAVATALTAPPPLAVVYSPAPTVVYSPAPVTYAPAPVYVQSAPVVVYAAPAYRPYYYAPPLVSFRFGWGGGYHHHGHW